MKLLFSILLFLFSAQLSADELRPAYLQLTEVQPNVFSVLWKVPARGDVERLALSVEFDGETTVVQPPQQGFVGGTHFSNWRVQFINGLPGTTIHIVGLDKTSTDVLLRVEYQDGASLAHRLTPAEPTYRVVDKPSLGQIALTYLTLGVEHILLGFDHLLFVLVLLLLIENVRKLIWTVTAFTVAHSVTLSLASLDIIFVPVPPVEACIALSIVFVATEIIREQQGHPGISQRSPWIVAFTFGLLHGLGFAAALGEIGLPQNAIPTALVLFNVGVEIGQLLFVAAFLLLTSMLVRIRLQIPAWGYHLPPYAIGSLASFWVIERTVGFWA